MWLVRLVLLVAATACLSRPNGHASPDGATGSGDGGVNSGDGGNIGPPKNLVFVTSIATTMSATSSLADADTYCRNAAMAAGVPGTFVAWMSDPTTAAKDRLMGFSGWVRGDGKPFANTVADLVAGKIYYPPRIGENGMDYGNDPTPVATGSLATGIGDALYCLGCSAGGGYVRTGVADGGNQWWSDNGSEASPTDAVRLYCFEIDYQAVAVPPAITGRTIFVSAGSQYGNMGMFGLDMMCNNEDAGTIALVAVGSTSGLGRLSPGTLPWVRRDGVVAIPMDASKLEAPIDVTFDNHYQDSYQVWGGAIAIGGTTDATQNCTQWTNGSMQAPAGEAGRSSSAGSFSGYGLLTCGQNAFHVYCADP